jgi:hypothetical protein
MSPDEKTRGQRVRSIVLRANARCDVCARVWGVRATTYDVVRADDGTPTDDWAPADAPKPVDVEPGKSCELNIHDGRRVQVEEL